MGNFKNKIVGKSPEKLELERILSLPVRVQPSPEDVEIESFERIKVEAFNTGQRLLPLQVDSLREFEACQGAFLPVGVGFGKSGISLMCSQIAYNKGWARKILLLLPVHLISGLVRRHIPEWRKRTNLSLTFHILQGTKSKRANIANSGAAGVYVLPYSLLSMPDAIDTLRAIDADMIVADEVHKLKNPRSACTKRLLHIMDEQEERGKRPIFVGMSGSMSTKGVMEYHHLIDRALGNGSPLPRKAGMAFTWGMVVDSNAAPTPGLAAGAMGGLVSWARASFPESKEEFEQRNAVANARAAFKHRLTNTPGVVASGDDRPDASLSVINLEADEPNDRIRELENQVRIQMVTPEGEPIDHAIHVYKWRRELSSGFYNSLVWPELKEFAKNRRIEESEAERRIQGAKSHLRELQTYHGLLRDFFKEAPLGLDTPTDVGRSIYYHGDKFVGPVLADQWKAVKEADFPERPDRLSIPVRVDDFKIRRCVEWAKEHKTGVIWVYHIEFGEWLVEALTEAGLDPVHCPSGADELIESIGDPEQGGKGDKLVVASTSAHGVGRNLQAFQNQLFAEWPRSAILAEQALGRVHRTGQTMDEVIAHTLITTDFDEMIRAATLCDSIYAQATLGGSQRVLYCDYDIPPKVFDPRVLKAQGAAPLTTDPKVWQQIKEKFGQ